MPLPSRFLKVMLSVLAIDAIDASVPELKSFALPGGHMHVSYCHIARRNVAEPSAVLRLSENEPVDEPMLNTCQPPSSYLFMLSRWIGVQTGATETPSETSH